MSRGTGLDPVLLQRIAADARQDGQPIQPLSTILGDSWVGYNHGIRLVGRIILIDGAMRDLSDVLCDPELAPLLSDGGVFVEARYPVPSGSPTSRDVHPGRGDL